MLNEYSVDCQPSSSRLTSGIHPFYKLLRALSLSRIFVEFSLQPLYPIMVGNFFQIYGILQINGKCIWEPKNQIRHFYSCHPWQNSPPSPNYNSPGRAKLFIHHKWHFLEIYHPSGGGGGERNYNGIGSTFCWKSHRNNNKITSRKRKNHAD